MLFQTGALRDDPGWDGPASEVLFLPFKLCSISCKDTLIPGKKLRGRNPASWGVHLERLFWHLSTVLNKSANWTLSVSTLDPTLSSWWSSTMHSSCSLPLRCVGKDWLIPRGTDRSQTPYPWVYPGLSKLSLRVSTPSFVACFQNC